MITFPARLLAFDVVEPVFVKVPVSNALLSNVDLFTTFAVIPEEVALLIRVESAETVIVVCSIFPTTVKVPSTLIVPPPTT